MIYVRVTITYTSGTTVLRCTRDDGSVTRHTRGGPELDQSRELSLHLH